MRGIKDIMHRVFGHSSPRAIIISAIALLALPFLTVELFYARLYHVLDMSSYLVFHNISEFFSVMVSLSIFGAGWFTFEQSRDRHALFLSSAFLAIGLMDFMHTLGYLGMPAFVTSNSANKSTQFWISARFFSAAAFLGSAYVYRDSNAKWISKRVLMAICFAVPAVVFCGITFFPMFVPATFIEGVGLTPFKKISEYLIIVLLLAASSAYWKRLSVTGNRLLLYYISAFIICIFSELVFAVYKSVFDTFNVLGHIYKIVAFALIYRGIFAASVTLPYLKLTETRDELQKEIGEHQRTEDSLRLFRNLLNQSNDAIFVVDPQTSRILDVNDKACSNLGYDRRELLSMGVTDIDAVIPAHFIWDAHVREVKDKGYMILEGRHRRKDGTAFPVEVNVKHMSLQGKDYMVAVARDITGRRRAEEILRKQKADLDEAQRLAHIGSWDWDAIKDNISWSEEYYRIYGLDPAKPTPNYEEHLKAYTSESAGRLDEAVKLAMKTGIPYELDLELAHPTESTRWIVARGEARFNEDGKISGLRGTAQNITERKKAEHEIRKLSKNLEEIIRERTAELADKNRDLERMNKLFVGRELRMVELKERIRELESRLDSSFNANKPGQSERA